MSTEPSEHIRFHRYLRDLEQTSASGEPGVVAAVLRNTDRAMATSAVLRHLDRRAGDLDGDEFTTWADRMTALVVGHDLLIQRIVDWSLLKLIAVAPTVDLDVDVLAAVSDWLQRRAAETAISSQALSALAEIGRTRRIRSTARARARELTD